MLLCLLACFLLLLLCLYLILTSPSKAVNLDSRWEMYIRKDPSRYNRCGCILMFSIQYHVGVTDQCRSIVLTALFHSYSKHRANWSASSADGSRPPHISGLKASRVAYIDTRLLIN